MIGYYYIYNNDNTERTKIPYFLCIFYKPSLGDPQFMRYDPCGSMCAGSNPCWAQSSLNFPAADRSRAGLFHDRWEPRNRAKLCPPISVQLSTAFHIPPASVDRGGVDDSRPTTMLICKLPSVSVIYDDWRHREPTLYANVRSNVFFTRMALPFGWTFLALSLCIGLNCCCRLLPFCPRIQRILHFSFLCAPHFWCHALIFITHFP